MLSYKKKFNALLRLAKKQNGIFTAKQAIAIGYKEGNHAYHVTSGNWRRIGHGLYILSSYSQDMASIFTMWSLWSRNQNGQPQGVISHISALNYYHLLTEISTDVHITVPGSFRKKNPSGIVVHKADLALSEIESANGFFITRVFRTLEDTRGYLKGPKKWMDVIQRAHQEGYLSVNEYKQLSTDNIRITSIDKDSNNDDVISSKKQAENERTMQTFYALQRGGWEVSNIQRRLRKRESAFTLVELLVVIGIISVLASILLPALQKAHKSSQEIACLNNMKQCGISLLSYTADFQSYLMPYQLNQYSGYSGLLTYWPSFLSSYSYLPTINMRNRSLACITRCPSLPITLTGDDNIYNQTKSYGLRATYLYNATPTLRFVKIHKVTRNPSRKFWLADTTYASTGYVYNYNEQYFHFDSGFNYPNGGNLNLNAAIHLRHFDMSNLWFLDGHAASKNMSQLIQLARDEDKHSGSIRLVMEDFTVINY